MSPRLTLSQNSKHSITRTFFLMLALILFPASLSAKLLVVTGPGGGTPLVRVFTDGTQSFNIVPYGKTFRGGVRVAVGDVNGDGVPDIITAPGPGLAPLIGVFDGNTGQRLPGRLGSFLAYSAFSQGGLFVAAGDVNGDGKDDIIVAPDAGMSPIVKVFDGNTGDVLRTFFAYSSNFLGGVRLAAGDVNGDGKADIITGAGPGAGPNVKVFDGSTGSLLKSLFAFPASFPGGVSVAAGDVNGDGKADIIVGAGPGLGPIVRVFDGVSNQVLQSFFAFGSAFQGGVTVGAGDVNGDGLADVITGAGPGGNPHVRVFSLNNPNALHNFLAYDTSFRDGIFVAGSRR